MSSRRTTLRQLAGLSVILVVLPMVVLELQKQALPQTPGEPARPSASVRPSALSPTPAAVSSAFTAPAASGGLRTPTRELTFLDRSGVLALTLESDPTSSAAGYFRFRTARDEYDTRGGTLKLNENGTLTLTYSGSLTVRVATSVTDANPPQTTARSVNGTLSATFDTRDHSGSATLTDLQSGNRYLLETARVSLDALAADLDRFEAACLTDAWSSLYASLAASLRQGSSLDTFSAQLRAQRSTLGRLAGLSRGGTGELQWSEFGVPFVDVSYEAIYQNPSTGALDRRTSQATFVYELGGWHYWKTSATTRLAF